MNRLQRLPFTICLCISTAALAEMRAPLQPKERTNGADVLAGLPMLHAQATLSSARIMDERGKLVVTATWVGSDGYLLTKASEVPQLEKLRVQWGDGRTASLREIRRATDMDLLLAQAVGVEGVKALLPATIAKTAYGQWLTSPARGGNEFRIGVLSAQSRKIPGMGAAIGVRMEQAPAGKRGVRVVGVAEDSPAAGAGLRENDVLLALAGEEVHHYQRVHEIISKRQPGDVIQVRYLRSGSEQTCAVKLASRSKVLMNWNGEDFANGGISVRTDNFPQVLQHDIPLGPRDMGGAVVDIEGRFIGINIARVDRVSTFALPAEVFWPVIEKWIEADRHPPKALPATAAAMQAE